MAITIETNISLELAICYYCGIMFGLPATFDQNRRDDKACWYCPNGHSQIYTGRPVRERLSEAECLTQRLRQEVTEAQADATRKARQLTSLRRHTKKASASTGKATG